jgi:hypothetical protein
MSEIKNLVLYSQFSGVLFFVFIALTIGFFFGLAQMGSKILPSSFATGFQYISFLAFFFLTVYWTFPGIYTIDSISQLLQAQKFEFNDWHPPILSALWGAGIFLFGTPTILFWLEFILFFFGLSIFYIYFYKNEASPLRLYLLSLCVVFIVSLFGVLMKDIIVAGALLVAFGMTTFWRTTRNHLISIVIFLAVFILAFLAVGSRHNALTAIIPLFVYMFLKEKTISAKRIFLAIFLSSLIGVFIFMLAHGVSYKVLKAEKWNIQEAIMIHDLAAIEQAKMVRLIPTEYQTKYANAESIRKALSTLSCEYLIYEEMNSHAPFRVLRSESTQSLRDIWFHALFNHPIDYFSHRCEVFLNFLGFWHAKPANNWFSTPPSDELTRGFGIVTENRFPGSVIVEHFFMKISLFFSVFTPFYYGWFWLGISLILLWKNALNIKKSDTNLFSFCIVSSGIMYILPYFFIVPCPNYRYFYWTVISTILGGFISMLPSGSRKQPDVSGLLNWRTLES